MVLLLPIDDFRLAWADHPRTYSSNREFAAGLWIGLNIDRNTKTLRPLITPLIERDDDIPSVLTHGDLTPRNIIIPKSLDHWHRRRRLGEQVCIIDWETAGWMPGLFEALKATMTEYGLEDGWVRIIRRVLPECERELEADWKWRSESGIPDKQYENWSRSTGRLVEGGAILLLRQ